MGFADQALRVLAKIVEVPTVNPPGQGYETFAKLAESILKDMGMSVEVVEVPSDYLDRYYPYAPAHRGYPRYVVLGRYGGGSPVLHFNGHYDVVPPGSGWSYDPFKATVVGDRVYGRGTTDMKGGIAAVLAAIGSLLREGFEPRGTVEVALVPDEEAGGVGSRYLVEGVLRSVPDYVVIAEPTTSTMVSIGHKGLVRGVVRVFGRQVHGSTPWLGENAFLAAARLALRFSELYEPVLKSRRTSAPVLLEQGAYPTINLGGYAESLSRKDNTVPGEFVLSFDRRVIPEESVDEVVRELREFLDRASREVGSRYELRVLSAVPPSVTPTSAEVVRLASSCIEEELGVKPTLYLTFGRNDLVYYVNFLKTYGICYGPGIENAAHTVDEYTTIPELENSVRVYRCIIRKALGG
jgi:succinyl-diaminopimelate desuccinylase